MASLIPKIKIGLAQNRKEKHNLSFDCSTTANIGTIQPTMCREMVPHAKFKVKVSSLVRLASMPLPSFGRMSLRHYHTFVPYVDLWQPFDAMMSGQHYQGTNVANFIPTKVPFFKLSGLHDVFINYSDISIAPDDDLDHPYTITTSNVDWAGNTYVVGDGDGEYESLAAAIRAAQAADLARIQTAWAAIRVNKSYFGGVSYDGIYYGAAGSLRSDDKGVLNLGDFYGSVKSSNSTLVIGYDGVSNPNVFLAGTGQTPITAQGADLITKVGTTGYTLLLKFKAPLKRLRTIFIGLGYQFSPYNAEEMSALKLLAYYKAWFTIFRPNREVNFVDTNCYKLIKVSSGLNGTNLSSGLGNSDWWNDFIHDLMFDCFYYLPMDYFSMSTLRPQQPNQDNSFTLGSGASDQIASNATPTSSYTAQDRDEVSVKTSTSAGIPNVSMASNGPLSPVTIKLALKMLTWANKNTVLGRSIRQYLKVHFGVTDVNGIDDENVYRIGSSRTNITISDVMSTAESSDGYLGEYGGKGIGYGDSEKFDFESDKFGVWLTLTAIVPESGYYQGYLKENRHLNRYQFFNPEFDAVGYQVLERGELMDDYNADSGSWNPRTGFARTGAFGFVPRYSEYKVGRNIVNGDLSLVGMYNSMAGYTLDRRISAGLLAPTGYKIGSSLPNGVGVIAPSFVPSVVYDNFRRIDPTDHLGQYNRIFNVATNDVDHFIIHNVFDVTAYAPMKSLTDSFDTTGSDDDGSIDVVHS